METSESPVINGKRKRILKEFSKTNTIITVLFVIAFITGFFPFIGLEFVVLLYIIIFIAVVVSGKLTWQLQRIHIISESDKYPYFIWILVAGHVVNLLAVCYEGFIWGTMLYQESQTGDNVSASYSPMSLIFAISQLVVSILYGIGYLLWLISLQKELSGVQHYTNIRILLTFIFRLSIFGGFFLRNLFIMMLSIISFCILHFLMRQGFKKFIRKLLENPSTSPN